MSNTDLFFTKESLLPALEETHQSVTDFFGSLSPESFFFRPMDGWSLAENLEHLIKSVKPVARAMRLPKVTLRLMFGTPKQASRQYHEIREAYVHELSKGAQASGKFLPDQAASASDLAMAQAKLLGQWKRTSDELLTTLEGWGDAYLDQYALPHPILGSLTIREMLFFTIYHDSRHTTPEGD